jgi:hypothetical protein
LFYTFLLPSGDIGSSIYINTPDADAELEGSWFLASGQTHGLYIWTGNAQYPAGEALYHAEHRDLSSGQLQQRWVVSGSGFLWDKVNALGVAAGVRVSSVPSEYDATGLVSGDYIKASAAWWSQQAQGNLEPPVAETGFRHQLVSSLTIDNRAHRQPEWINNRNHIGGKDGAGRFVLWLDQNAGLRDDQPVNGTPDYALHEWDESTHGVPPPQLNARLEGLLYAPAQELQIWRNGRAKKISSFLDPSLAHQWSFNGGLINDGGVIVTNATRTLDDQGQPSTNPQTEPVLLVPIEVVSRDKFLAGSIEIPSVWNSLELEFVGPEGENLGKYGDLLGGGATKIYDEVTDILSDADVNAGSQPATQQVWFVRDSENARKVHFYTCFNALGSVRINLYVNGSSTAAGFITHDLIHAQDFAETISYVDSWVKGIVFNLPGEVTPPPMGLQSMSLGALSTEGSVTPTPISHLTRAALIPFFSVINQVEGLAAIAAGLFDGARTGVEDDWAFIQLIGQAGVEAGDWAYLAAAAELTLWKTSPLKRAGELKQMADKVCEEFVFRPLLELGQDLGTWEGFRRRSWQTLVVLHEGNAKVWAVTRHTWSDVVDGMTGWADDFCVRMMDGAELAHWNDTPWAKDALLAEIGSQTRLMSYTFGYTFGYLTEQIAVGALSAGTVKMAQVAAKGGVVLSTTLAKRTAASLAARAHMLKRLLAEGAETIPESLVAAYQRSFSVASTGPVGEGMPRLAMEMMQEAATAGNLVWREYVDALVGKTSLRRLVAQGGEGIIERRFAQLMHLLGDDFSAEIGRNFLKIADEVILVSAPNGNVDEFFEAFFRAFDGNPGLMVNADIGATFSKNSLSAEGKATLKKFLSGPDAGKLWEIDVPAIVDNEPAVPHNYWVRGILAELSIYKRVYKNAGYTHAPTAAGYDFKSAVEYVQIKTLKNPDGAINAMKKAVDDLVEKSPGPPINLKLHILKKPGTTSEQLRTGLLEYIENKIGAQGRMTIVIDEFELTP